MENINLNIEKTLDFISKEKLASYEPKVKACMETLEKGTSWVGCIYLLPSQRNTWMT
jgi:hypothetical protein